MNIQFKIGILVGLFIAYIILQIARSNSKKPVSAKYYIDDTTKVYMAIAAVIIVLIVICLL